MVRPSEPSAQSIPILRDFHASMLLLMEILLMEGSSVGPGMRIALWTGRRERRERGREGKEGHLLFNTSRSSLSKKFVAILIAMLAFLTGFLGPR